MLLFGEKCQAYVTYTVEARKKSEELFQNFNKGKKLWCCQDRLTSSLLMTAITMLYHIRRRNRRSLKNICGENLIYSVLKIGCCLKRNVNPVRHILLRQKLEELFQNFNKGKNQQSFSSDHLIKESSVESASFFSFGDQLEMTSSN